MKVTQLICLAALTSPFIANADTLSIAVGGGVWNESASGNFQTTSDAIDVDVEDNLFWDKESQGYLFVTLEHFIPVLPNIRLLHTTVDHSGNGTTAFQFDGQLFTGDVGNDVSVETTDLIAYYEVLDNIVSLDLGLNIRNLKIDYTITSNTLSSTTSDSVSATIPMIYAMIGVSPLPDLTVSGELSYIGYDGNSISDFTAKIAYTTEYYVGFEAGYRKQNIELDDTSDTTAKLAFDGVFAGAYLKF